MKENDEKIWLMTIKNCWKRSNFLKKEYVHTRYLDEYFTDTQELIKRIKETALQHGGFDKKCNGEY